MQAEITAFQAKADHLAEQLLQLIERLRQGYAPDQKTVDDLTCAAVELRAMYREIAEKALENVAEADKSDYSVSELARLWEEHNVRHRQEQKQAVLERFLRVSSDEAGFDEALAPYREKVDCLLAELLNNSTDDATIAPYAAFLQVMDLPAEEMDGPNGEAQLEALDGVFAAKVQRGLMRGRYRESLPPLFRQPDTEKVQKFAIQQESSQQDRAEGEKVSAPISTEAQELPRLTPCYPTKTMERAKRCVSDMEKVPGAFTILSLLLRCGALSFSQLCGWGATIASSVEITETKMERLAQMGYVNACMLDGEKLWWLAPSVNALLAKNLVREALYRFGVMHSFSLPGKGSLPFDQGPSGDSLRLHALSTEN